MKVQHPCLPAAPVSTRRRASEHDVRMNCSPAAGLSGWPAEEGLRRGQSRGEWPEAGADWTAPRQTRAALQRALTSHRRQAGASAQHRPVYVDKAAEPPPT